MQESPRVRWVRQQEGKPSPVGRLYRTRLNLERINRRAMKKAPSFPFYVQDWLASPTRLQMSFAQRGMFWDLLAIAWDSNPPCTIPKSPREIARICGARVASVRVFVASFPQVFIKFPHDSGRLYNKKLFEIYTEMMEHREKKQDAGKVGAKARWQPHSNRIGVPMANDSLSSSSSISSSSSKEHTTECDPIAMAFASFWEAYPIHRQGSRTMAMAEWVRVPLMEMHPTEIMAGLRAWLGSEDWKTERFIPYAQNFVQKQMWKIPPPPKDDGEPEWKKRRAKQESENAEKIHGLLELAKQPRTN